MRLQARLLLVALAAAAVVGLFAPPAAADEPTTTSGGSTYTERPIPNSWIDFWVPSWVDWKERLQENYGIPLVLPLPENPNGPDAPPGPRASSGNQACIVQNLAPGEVAGTSGCGPCIGVIVVAPPDANGVRRIWVFHFAGSANPYAELDKYNFPTGSHIVVFGGDGNDPYCSMPQMGSLYNWIVDNSQPFLWWEPRIIVDGYFNTPSLYVNCKGEYLLPLVDARCRADDGSYPRPPLAPPTPPTPPTPPPMPPTVTTGFPFLPPPLLPLLPELPWPFGSRPPLISPVGMP